MPNRVDGIAEYQVFDTAMPVRGLNADALPWQHVLIFRKGAAADSSLLPEECKQILDSQGFI